jgi:hypothetical protein
MKETNVPSDTYFATLCVETHKRYAFISQPQFPILRKPF